MRRPMAGIWAGRAALKIVLDHIVARFDHEFCAFWVCELFSAAALFQVVLFHAPLLHGAELEIFPHQDVEGGIDAADHLVPNEDDAV